MYDINGNMQYTDSGYWFLANDRNAEETIHSIVAPETPTQENLIPLCKELPFCGLPAHHPLELNSGYLIPFVLNENLS